MGGFRKGFIPVADPIYNTVIQWMETNRSVLMPSHTQGDPVAGKAEEWLAFSAQLVSLGAVVLNLPKAETL